MLLQNRASPECPLLRDAIISFLDVKRKAGCRPIYLERLGEYLRMFSRLLGEMRVCDVELSHVEQWFGARQEAPSGEKGNRGKLSSLFSFCVRKGWLAENPIRRMEPIRVPHKPPAVLAVEQCRTALDYTRTREPRFIRRLIAMLLLGVRPHEARMLTAGDWKADCLVIDEAASKTHRRRVIPLSDQTREWLAIAPGCPPASPSQVDRYIQRLRDALGLRHWQPDILRHTYASYALASGMRVDELTDRLGNSRVILFRHYREIVSAKDAAEFFALRP